ncbi:MAG: TIGR02300 family protein [Methylocella sp.]
MAKPALGNKHHCQNCGTRFFDLNASPIVCPKCGTVSQTVPLSRAAQSAAAVNKDKREVVPVAELVSLEEADAGEDKVVVVADDDIEIEPADDPFLEEEEEEEEEDNDDVGDLIDGEIGEEEER